MDKIPGVWFPQIYETLTNQKRVEKIDKLLTLDHLTFRNNYASKSIPFILKNYLSPKSKEQTLKILLKEFSEFIINVRFGDMSKSENYINRRIQDMPLSDFVNNHFVKKVDGEIAYAGSNTINNIVLSKLEIALPSFYPNDFFNEPRLWMGRAGTITHLHKDIPDNFAINYFGKKRWVLYPPKDFPNLYMINPNQTELPDFGVSLINLKEVDLARFPLFSSAANVEFILDSGDMLYLPAGWSHFVENIEDTLMINLWLKREKSPAILNMDK